MHLQDLSVVLLFSWSLNQLQPNIQKKIKIYFCDFWFEDGVLWFLLVFANNLRHTGKKKSSSLTSWIYKFNYNYYSPLEPSSGCILKTVLLYASWLRLREAETLFFFFQPTSYVMINVFKSTSSECFGFVWSAFWPPGRSLQYVSFEEWITHLPPMRTWFLIFLFIQKRSLMDSLYFFPPLSFAGQMRRQKGRWGVQHGHCVCPWQCSQIWVKLCQK